MKIFGRILGSWGIGKEFPEFRDVLYWLWPWKRQNHRKYYSTAHNHYFKNRKSFFKFSVKFKEIMKEVANITVELEDDTLH